MSKLVSNTVYQTISMTFPSAKADDGAIRVSFALDVKDGVGIGLSGGGVWKGEQFIGSFDGFSGFAHNVTGEDAAAVDSVLAELSEALESEFGIPAPVVVSEEEKEAE